MSNDNLFLFPKESNPAAAGALIVLDFEGNAVRAVRRAGEPWFVLADVCRVLEIGNPSDASKRLDDDEKATLDNTEGRPGAGAQQFTIINESGLYSLILTSRKPAAKRFKKWVTAEVLPEIRRTGGYMVAAPDETPEELALRALTVMQATVERQKKQIAEMAPKVEALDRIATASGSLCITDSAKALQLPPRDLFNYLRKHGWIYKRPGAAHDIGYQARVASGDLEHKVTTVLKPDGSEKVTEQVRITPQGLTKLAKLISKAARSVGDAA